MTSLDGKKQNLEEREVDRGSFLAWFAGHHVASNLLMIGLLAAGFLALSTIKVEVFPELSLDTISVLVPYLGASPAEVEEGVCIRVEEAIAGIEGIKKIRSVAGEGRGSVIAELHEDADLQRVLDDVKAAVDRIDTFPAEAEKPVISESITRRQVITVALHGDVPESTLKALIEQVRDDLTAIDGISQVDLAGVRNYEISVEISEEDLRRWGLTLEQVADVIRRSSLDLPAGSIETAGGDVLVRTKGQRYRGREFEEIVVLSRPDGTRVRLGDIARVVDGFEDSDQAARFDGRASALARVFRVGSEDALEIAEKVKSYVATKEPMLPAGVSIDTWEDYSRILESRLNLLLKNAALGLILVFISLVLFLDLRLAFWTTMGIPISFLGALWLLPHLGVSINMISLFAFIVALGIVVDDAIVVGENVFAYSEQGVPLLRAAIIGVKEMAVPVTFAVLTSIAAFLPLMFTAGFMGKIMRQIPLVVVSVLAISLIEALLILPAHLAGHHGLPRFLRPILTPLFGAIEHVRLRAQAALSAFINGPYKRTLARAVAWRYTTLAIGLASLMIVAGFVRGGFIGFTFMPRVDADNVVAAMTLAEGTPLWQTEAAVTRLEEAARQVQAELDAEREGQPSAVKHIASTIGQQPFTNRRGPMAGAADTSAANIAEVNVELLSSEERDFPSALFQRRWRELVGGVAGAKELTFSANLFTAGDAINIELAHPKFETLLTAVERLKGAVAEYPGTNEISDSFLEGKRELKLELTPEGRAAGLTLADLARQVRSAFYGAEAQRIQRGRDDVRVMVRYPEVERQSLESIQRMRIRLPNGSEVPFRTVAVVADGRGYASIYRAERRRVVSVTADVDPTIAAAAGTNANDINRDLVVSVLPQLARDFPGLTFGFEGEQREQAEAMGSLARNFLVAQLAIFGLLAIPFRSYTQPAIVMSAIPFGIVGAVVGHVIMGLDLSLLSMFGIVALTGVVVNDSLIIIDLINRERSEGIPLPQVIRDAGVRRFRPILLTTLTTFLGLTPIILERSLQARFLIPMAVSLGFGVVFATAITLLLVPSLYMILEDFHGLFGEEEEKEEEGAAEPEATPEEGPSPSWA